LNDTHARPWHPWLRINRVLRNRGQGSRARHGRVRRDPGRWCEQTPHWCPLRLSHPVVHVHRRPAGRGFPQLVWL